MKHFDKIKDILAEVDPGRPVVQVILSGSNNLRIREYPWSPNLQEDSFHKSMVNQFTRRDRVISGDNKGYSIDVTNTVDAIRAHVVYNFIHVFTEACPNKEPRRTSLYKSIVALTRQLNNRYDEHNLDALSLMFDIYEYYWSTTKEVSLNNETNSVHRKNIYHLINILEQKHGRKENSNR